MHPFCRVNKLQICNRIFPHLVFFDDKSATTGAAAKKRRWSKSNWVFSFECGENFLRYFGYVKHAKRKQKLRKTWLLSAFGAARVRNTLANCVKIFKRQQRAAQQRTYLHYMCATWVLRFFKKGKIFPFESVTTVFLMLYT